MIVCSVYSQTASFGTSDIYRIQNNYGYVDLGSSNAPVTSIYFDPISLTVVSTVMQPIGPLPFYIFRTNFSGYMFDKNIISNNGQFSSYSNQLSFNFASTGRINTVITPAMIIEKTNGKVGVGHLSSLTIGAKLDIKAGNVEGLKVTTNHTTDWKPNTMLVVNRNNCQAVQISNTNYNGTGLYKDVFRIMGDGNTSIGDQSIHGITWGKCNIYANKYQAGLVVNTISDNVNMEGITANVNNSYHKALVVKLNGVENFKVNGSGDFSARGGKITAGPFPDFVFESDYVRMNYIQKETYVKRTKHLPYMPTAEEVKTNGLDLGTSILGITQNVEENTLDIIEIYKALEALKAENEKLKLVILKLQDGK